MSSFWMPKKQPLYAPMLSTFGGGSARGFGSGLPSGGGGTVFDKYGEVEAVPTTVTRVWSFGTGPSIATQGETAGAISSSSDPADFDTQGSVIGPYTYDRPMYVRPVAGKTWSTMNTTSDIDTQYFPQTTLQTSASLTVGVTYYADDTSHYCYGSRVLYDRSDSSGVSITVRSYAAQDVTVNRSYLNKDFSMQPNSQRFSTVMDSLDGFYATASKDQSGNFFNTSGQHTMHMYQGFGYNSSDEEGFAASVAHNTHGNTGRGVFLGGKKFSDGTSDAYYMAQYNNHSGTGGADGYQIYKLDFNGTNGFSLNRANHYAYYRNGTTAFDSDSGAGDYLYRLPSKWPYAFTHYDAPNISPSDATWIHDLSASSSPETSTAARPHQIETSQTLRNMSIIHNDGSGTLTGIYHTGSAYYLATINTSTLSWTSSSSLLSSNLSNVAGIRPIPGTNRLLAVGVNSAEYIEIS